jgi:hypothetical protein
MIKEIVWVMIKEIVWKKNASDRKRNGQTLGLETEVQNMNLAGFLSPTRKGIERSERKLYTVTQICHYDHLEAVFKILFGSYSEPHNPSYPCIYKS